MDATNVQDGELWDDEPVPKLTGGRPYDPEEAARFDAEAFINYRRPVPKDGSPPTEWKLPNPYPVPDDIVFPYTIQGDTGTQF